jgi:hypothetical protein
MSLIPKLPLLDITQNNVGRPDPGSALLDVPGQSVIACCGCGCELWLQLRVAVAVKGCGCGCGLQLQLQVARCGCGLL